MCAELADCLARLHEQRLVALEILERTHNRIECFPTARGATGTTVHDKPIRILGHVRIQIVHQHPHGCFLMPTFARELDPTRRTHCSFPAHMSSNLPDRIASAIRAMSADNARSCVSAGAISRTISNA